MTITKKELLNAIFKIETCKNPGPYYYFTSGTGVPCYMAIEHFKNTNDVIVVDRKKRMWKNGIRYKPNIKPRSFGTTIKVAIIDEFEKETY